MVFALFVRCHFSCCFWHILSLNLQLSEVWLWCFLVWISLGLCIQSFAQIFKSMYVFFHIWKNFSLSFLSIFENCSAVISPSTFFSADLFLCFLDSSDTNSFWWLCLLFQPVFSLRFSLGNSYGLSHFTDFFPVVPSIQLLKFLKISMIVFLKILKFPNGFSSYILFLCWDFQLLQEFIVECWSIFMTAALKFLPHSNICVILMLMSVDYLFSFKWRFFLVLGLARNFRFYPWNCWYCYEAVDLI